MQVRIDTIFFLIYCATAVHPKKQQRNRLDNEVLDKSEVMLKFANNIFNMPEEKPTKNFRRNAVHTKVEPVEVNCLSTEFKQSLSELKRKVRCKPRDTVVDLVAQPDTMIIPNSVIVKRCGGTCDGKNRCLPVERRNVTIYVRTKRGLKVSCSSISVPEDTRCKCDCERKEECTSFQIFRKDLCGCACKDGPKPCSQNFKWDMATCSCVCSRACTTGTVLDPNRCTCVARKQ